jgi:ketosteroid isomerase-like protein
MTHDSLVQIERFINAIQNRDMATVNNLLREDVTLVMPMTFSGHPQPEFVTHGRDETLGYFQTVFDNFSQIRFINPVYTLSLDTHRVFVETRGDFITARGSIPYQNVYLFRFDLQDGKIVFIHEYANPVPASAVLGIPLGNIN